MRILVLTPDAFGRHGGMAKFDRDLITALCAHPECTEVVAIPRLMPNPPGPLPAKLTYVTAGLNSNLRYVVAALNVVRSNPRFDLTFCPLINLLPIAFLLRPWVRAPIVAVVHGVDAWKPTSRRVTNYLVGNIDAFIAVSELTKQRFLGWAKLDSDKAFLLPPAIDLEAFRPGPKDAALLDRYGLTGKTVLMTLGRLASDERYKGFDEILELLPTLSTEIPNVAYLIVGDGSDRPRLEKKARALGVHDRVVFGGLISEAEKADHYRLADTYVMPGWGEGFGIVYLEAMACGIPVVASKVDGSREAVRHGALGNMVDPSDQQDIKAGILEALNRPKGVVPEGLDYFSYGNFARRLHLIVESISASEEAVRGEYGDKA
jgi:phosphatidyl-myo-inositol dimannoside synthase